MSATIVAAILLGALLHASWNVFIRAAADKKLNTLLVAGGAGVWSACWLPFGAAPRPGEGAFALRRHNRTLGRSRFWRW